MKLYGHVQTISATRASKLFSGKLQESISESHSVMSNPLQPHGEYWSGQPFPSPGDISNPGIEPRSPTLQADSLPAEPQGKSITICNSTFTEFIQGRILRVTVFYNSLAIEQYLLAKNFTSRYDLVNPPIKLHELKK